MTRHASVIDSLKFVIHSHPLFRPVLALNELRWWLRGTLKGSFAQHGEDRFLLEYFGIRVGCYIDVGANHPYKLSNTYLLYRKGWRGINIEPIPALHGKIARKRPQDLNLNIGIGRERGSMTFYEMHPNVLSTFNREVQEALVRTGQARLRNTYEVPIRSVTDVYREYMSGADLDLLLIDTEGFEMDVLNGIDWDLFRPKLIVIETTTLSGLGGKTDIARLLEQQHYEPIQRLGCNTIFELRIP